MRFSVVTLLSSALITFFAACEKNNRDISPSITGEWELLRISGSRPVINYPSGNGNVIKFTNSSYESFENGRLVKTGTYTIVEDASVQASVCLVLPQEKYRNRIIYDNDYNATKKFIDVSSDTLSILSGCFATDAGSNIEYIRRR
jgi:hypothetical protein